MLDTKNKLSKITFITYEYETQRWKTSKFVGLLQRVAGWCEAIEDAF